MTIHELISIILMLMAIIYFVVLMIMTHKRYGKFLEVIAKEKPEYLDSVSDLWSTDRKQFAAGHDWFIALLPIKEKVSSPETLSAIKSHKKIISIFWLSAITIIPSIIFWAKMN